MWLYWTKWLQREEKIIEKYVWKIIQYIKLRYKKKITHLINKIIPNSEYSSHNRKFVISSLRESVNVSINYNYLEKKKYEKFNATFYTTPLFFALNLIQRIALQFNDLITPKIYLMCNIPHLITLKMSTFLIIN